MKKSNIFLWALSMCGIVSTFAFVAVNTIRTQNARQSVVSTVGYENYEKAEEKTNEQETEVVKGVSIPTKIESTTENTEEITEIQTQDYGIKPYIKPISNGKIIAQYQDSTLVFQPTYGDYRTHLGIDIEASENTPVLCVNDGIVISSEMDFVEGYVVKVEHDDGKVSIYKNLSTNKMAPLGKVIKQGETIGAVGTSGAFESHLPPHLHFEMQEDNVEINPTEYIK